MLSLALFSLLFRSRFVDCFIEPNICECTKYYFGNILGIADSDVLQVEIIIGISFIVLLCLWKDLLAVFSMKATLVQLA